MGCRPALPAQCAQSGQGRPGSSAHKLRTCMEWQGCQALQQASACRLHRHAAELTLPGQQASRRRYDCSFLVVSCTFSRAAGNMQADTTGQPYSTDRPMHHVMYVQQTAEGGQQADGPSQAPWTSSSHAKLVCGPHGAVCQPMRDGLAILRAGDWHEDLPDTELLHL